MNYKEKIIEMVKGIESQRILEKIYTVVKTHVELLEKKGRQEPPDKTNQIS